LTRFAVVMILLRRCSQVSMNEEDAVECNRQATKDGPALCMAQSGGRISTRIQWWELIPPIAPRPR
jgi:hypothetical protein